MSALARSAVNALLVVASVTLCLAGAELYLMWDDRRPQIAPTRLQLGGGEFRVWEPPERLADFRNAAVVIGDSFTAGEACADGRNYPSHLARLAGRGSEPYRVLNLGVPGADPMMYLQLTEGLVTSGRVPAAALVTLYSNDVELTCSACRFLERVRADPSFGADEIARLEAFCATCTRTRNSPGGHYGVARQVHTWLYKKLHVYGLLRDAAVGVSMKAGFNLGWGRSAYPALWQNPASLEFKLLRFALAGVRDSLAQAGVPRMMVVIYPDVENLRPDNAYVAIYRGVEQELSRSLGVPVLSGYPAFLDSREAQPNMPFSLVDHHPSCKAHEIFAGWVFGRLHEMRSESALVPVRSR
jgi:hypothetical protein